MEALEHPTVFEIVESTGDTLQHWEPSLEAVPTQAESGSPEKIATLQSRLEHAQDLWHPEDRQSDWQEFRRLTTKLGE